MVNIKKLESTQALLAETRDRTLNDSGSWNDYILNAAVKFYKYNYEEQLLIHTQRPYATACAPYDLWNKQFQRYVMRHTKGIALLTRMADGSTGLRYVFDVSDTGGKQIAPLWKYREENEEAVKDALCEAFRQDGLYPLNSLIRAACSSEAFSWLSDQGYLGPNTLRHLIERNAEVAVLERMGLRGKWMPEFNGIDGLDYEEAELLYRGINYVAGRILRTVEKTIKQERDSKMAKPFMEENENSFTTTEEVTIPEEETESGEPAPKYIVENGIPYVLVGDFYIPDLRAEEAKPAQIGRFGRARLKILEENRPEEVHRMLLDGNLNETLEQLNDLAMDKIRELTTELEKTNPAPDKMKQQLAWVAHMNMLREQATEIIMNELIYA